MLFCCVHSSQLAHLAATDVRDGMSAAGESGRRIPLGHSNAGKRKFSLPIGRYAARTPCASTGLPLAGHPRLAW